MSDQSPPDPPLSILRPALVPGHVVKADELCEMLGVCRTTLWRMTTSGGLPHVRLTARAIAFRTDDVIEWLEARTHRAGPPRTIAPLDTTAGARRRGRPSNAERQARIVAAEAAKAAREG